MFCCTRSILRANGWIYVVHCARCMVCVCEVYVLFAKRSHNPIHGAVDGVH